jgi:hypothetical protein
MRALKVLHGFIETTVKPLGDVEGFWTIDNPR